MSDTEFWTRIGDQLDAKFKFKTKNETFWRKGKCPDCKDNSLWCAAQFPMVVKCDHQTSCRYDRSVKDILPDEFEDWSKRAPVTEDNPNATADAYLTRERGLDIASLAGAYSQEYYRDNARNIGSATVRFPLPGGSWWERIIDRPGRFENKANFKFGGSYGGHCWIHPQDTIVELAAMDEIWIEEGIFDSAMTRQCFPAGDAKAGVALRGAVAAMSSNNYPKHFLAELAQACAAINRKDRPLLVFAYDVGDAGVKGQMQHSKLAREQGWPATAAQVRPDGEGVKTDWNDLGLRHKNWSGDPEKAPFSDKSLKQYLANGAITIAETFMEKARLLQAENVGRRSFFMRHRNRLYWVAVKDKEDGNTGLDVDQIADCGFRILYRERDDYNNVTNYFIRIDHPDNTPSEEQNFTSSHIASSAEFKKRLLDFGGLWLGSTQQLERIFAAQKHNLKRVEPLHFTGYSAAHKAWVLGDIAVHEGRLIKVNKEKYFEIGKVGVKISSRERPLQHIVYDPDQIDFDWIEPLWLCMGPQGLVALAFFTMSLFAQQIRDKQDSLGFLEVTGDPGSGKTMLLTFLWKLLGRSKYEGLVPDKHSAASLGRNMIKFSNLPVGLIEGKRDAERKHQKEFDWSELLSLYDGRSPRGTGNKANSTDTFEPPFLGSMYLCQNERIDAMDAVLQRLMSFPINLGDRTDETAEAARAIASWPIERASGYIVHVLRKADAWLEFYFKRFEHHKKDIKVRQKDLHHDRCIKNHAQLAAAVETLAKLLPISQPRIDQAIRLVDWMALDRQQSSGADHPLVRRFWDQVEYLDSIEDDTAERPLNAHRKADNGLIAINLPHFEERARARGQAPIDMAALHKLLPNSKTYRFVGKKPVNCHDGKSRHCWVFQSPNSQKPVI